jgi:hypothetical protein
MGEVYGLATGKFAAQGLQLQVGLKGVRLQIIQHLIPEKLSEKVPDDNYCFLCRKEKN